MGYMAIWVSNTQDKIRKGDSKGRREVVGWGFVLRGLTHY